MYKSHNKCERERERERKQTTLTLNALLTYLLSFIRMLKANNICLLFEFFLFISIFFQLFCKINLNTFTGNNSSLTNDNIHIKYSVLHKSTVKFITPTRIYAPQSYGNHPADLQVVHVRLIIYCWRIRALCNVKRRQLVTLYTPGSEG